MKDFSRIRFDGKFRDYQQGVLNRAQRHLRDRRIHIVAAPGSGKTILGLELIARMKAPALVLSPSVTIRQQWGERFSEKFLPKGESEEEYVSYDLKSPGLITSVTYQALHAAVTKQTLIGEDDSDDNSDDNSDDEEATASETQGEDFSDFNIFQLLRTYGIKTICLDEAHHLKSEWQKALEKFIDEVKKETTVIALTATPPYDSSPAEWNRYISLCGEIDEEIFVPQLVAQKTLCPHQDFVLFSYPTADEAELSEEYKLRGIRTAEEILHSELFGKILDVSGINGIGKKISEETVLDNLGGYSALIACAEYVGKTVPDRVARLARGIRKKTEYNIFAAEEAFGFVVDTPSIFTEEISETLRSTLSGCGLIEKRKVCLTTNDKINKRLVASAGKLGSIGRIVASESAGLGKKLRMLILTDYIKKDMMKLVGSDEPLGMMGTVPVFESVRRSCPDVAVGMLSGSLVVIPNDCVVEVGEIAASMGVGYSTRPLETVEHSEVNFSGSNKNKVAVITETFRRGLINVLVGTKSLLGEGWDSPCINSLILASFVGSFMLSNQMRGRAIRTDRDDPDKVSNVWHLVTVEPPVKSADGREQLLAEKSFNDKTRLYGGDYETLQRRFDCFLAPAYHSEIIESGTDRLDIIKPPFDNNGIERINGEMLSLAADRKATAKQWFASLKGSTHPEILDVVEIIRPARPKSYVTKCIVGEVALAVSAAMLIVMKANLGDGLLSSLLSAIGLVALVVVIVTMLRVLMRILRLRNCQKTVETLAGSVLSSLKKIGEIESGGTKISVRAVDGRDGDLYCMLFGATAHEKKVFSASVSELLAPVDNPRYVIVKSGRLGKNYSHCYACPAALAVKKESAQMLADSLKKAGGRFVAIYTRGDNGRDELLGCRKESYINAANSAVKRKKVAAVSGK